MVDVRADARDRDRRSCSTVGPAGFEASRSSTSAVRNSARWPTRATFDVRRPRRADQAPAGPAEDSWDVRFGTGHDGGTCATNLRSWPTTTARLESGRHHGRRPGPPTRLGRDGALHPGREVGENGGMPPFRFLADAREAVPGRELAERARRAEGMGYHALVIPDHLLDQLSPLVAMTADRRGHQHAAGGRVRPQQRPAAPGRVGPRPRSHRRHLRRPAGRCDRRGVEQAGVRGDRYDIRPDAGPSGTAGGGGDRASSNAFRDESFSFAGEHYRISDYTGQPSVQRPHPPVMIGGGGRRTLTLAGREADIVGLAPRVTSNGLDARSLTLEATREKLAWVAQAAGDRYADLEFNVYPSGWPPVLTNDLSGEVAPSSPRCGSRPASNCPSVRCWTPRICSSDPLTDWRKSSNNCGPIWASTRSWWARVGELEPVVAKLAGT